MTCQRVSSCTTQLGIAAAIALWCGCAGAPDTGDDKAYDGEDLTDTDDTETLTIGTFNIEWLTADPLEGDMRRNDVDHDMIRQLIESFDPDVLVLQEIDGPTALDHLGLGSGWGTAIGDTGWSQNIAIIWRRNRVSVTEIQELDLPTTTGASKEPLTARVSAGGLNLTLVGLHHAAYADDEAARTRLQQAAALSDWLSDTNADARDGFGENVVLAGDMNDTFEGINPRYPSLSELDSQLSFATENCTGGTQIDFESRIDHIGLSAPLLDRWDGGCTIVTHDQQSPYSDYSGGYRNTQNISDHRPVWVQLTLD